MKRIVIPTLILLCVMPLSVVASDSCKPDVSGQDTITKKQVAQWQQVLSSSGFLSAALMDNDVTFTAYVQRGGDKNFVMVSIQKLEENQARAAFESHFHGAKGDQLLFGFKNGEPLTFVVTEVSNQAKVEGLITAKLNMSVVWAAEVSDADMAAMRDALTTKQVDAIRISQASGQVDQSVPDKNGKRLMEKFGCFYQALDKRGIDLSAASKAPQSVGDASKRDERSEDDAVSVQGKYVRKGKNSDFIELRHGTFSVLQDGHSLEGTYTVQGDALTLTSPRMRVPAKGRFIGDTIKDEDGIVWEKQGEPAKLATPLTIDQIIQMVTAKLADDIIIATIQKSGSKFDLAPEALIKLKGAGVSDAVIRAMAR